MLRRNILLVIGLLALLSGAALSAFWVAGETAADRSAAPRPQGVSVLAALHPVATGTLLRPEDMSWIEVASPEAGKNLIVRSAGAEAEYVGALARRDFRAGEPFSADDLLKSADRSFLAAVLGPGKRAVTLAVEAQQTASGLILPGDRVNVILTQNLGAATDAGRRSVAETVLSDIRVVAVEQTLSASAKPLIPERGLVQELRAPRTITLEMSEQDAQRLLVATQLGKVNLAVRALAISAVPTPDGATPPTWADDVSPAIRAMSVRSAKPPAAPVPAAAPAAPAARNHYTIEVMHGAKIETR